MMEEKKTNDLMEWIKSLVIAVVLAVLIHTFLFAVVIVSGPSMEPTLHDGERLIMNKIVYLFHEPERGDVVVFHATEADDYIKRVIGIAGDTIEFRNNHLFLNGKPVEEPYLTNAYTKDFGPVTVPEGTIFVMGDNRINSKDSREIGAVPLDKVVGRVKLLIWPIHHLRMVP